MKININEFKNLYDDELSLVFVSGNFNIIHPGHIRLLNFAAECGDILVVGLNPDSHSNIIVSETLRLENVLSIGIVKHAFIMDGPVEEIISIIKPDLVVKGKEHEKNLNPEKKIIESYGGKLLFCSGTARFSSTELLHHEIYFSKISKPEEYLERHRISASRIVEIIDRYRDLKIVVIGDLIVDEYIACEPLGMSREDPTIVISPLKNDLYVGGAGIVACHAKGLGANVSYFGVTGCDSTANWALKKMEELGVGVNLFEDISRPTTLKQRFRASGKTLLRVSHLRQHSISNEISAEILSKIESELENADLLIFSDFNYGCLPQILVDSIIQIAKKNAVPMAADSQTSSQIGDVSRFYDMELLTPTEYEARVAIQDHESGLVVLTEKLIEKSNVKNLLVTLGADGVFIHSPANPSNGLITDRLPSLNNFPKDVAGAGDSFLISSSMALSVGATIWESAYIGSVAAACQVNREGNIPLSIQELKLEFEK